MPRPKKHVANSRANGSKASNKGSIVSAKIPVLCPKVLWRGGDPVITFTKVFKAKLHKNEIYSEQKEADSWAAEAKQVIKDAARGADCAAECDRMSVSAARSILKAYWEATNDPA